MVGGKGQMKSAFIHKVRLISHALFYILLDTLAEIYELT